MRKAQLLFDHPAECEQFGLLPRRGDDLHAERLLIRPSGRRQCEDREADERDDEGDGDIVDRRFEAQGLSSNVMEQECTNFMEMTISVGTGLAFFWISGGAIHG